MASSVIKVGLARPSYCDRTNLAVVVFGIRPVCSSAFPLSQPANGRRGVVQNSLHTCHIRESAGSTPAASAPKRVGRETAERKKERQPRNTLNTRIEESVRQGSLQAIRPPGGSGLCGGWDNRAAACCVERIPRRPWPAFRIFRVFRGQHILSPSLYLRGFPFPRGQSRP